MIALLPTLSLMVFLLTFPLMAVAQVRINGHAPFVDKANGRLLFVTPQTTITSLTATVAPNDTAWTALTVDGRLVASATAIDFGDVSNGRTFTLSGQCGDKDSMLTIGFTCLPVVELKKTTAFTNDYEPCRLIIDEPDSAAAAPVYQAKVKHRGGTTNTAGRHKRNYHFKLLDDQGESLDLPLLGMREDNGWLLDAGQIDLFRLRNHICHELWLDCATKPYYYEQEPKSVNGCHVRLIELFVNDEYRGVYSLMEPVDRKQLKLKKYKKGVKGCLWKATGWQATMFYNAVSSYDNRSATLGGFEAKYPEPGDDADTTDYAPLVAAINFVATATDDEFKQHIADYIDLPVLEDYVLFIDLINGIDNRGKNCYWSIYDKTKSGRMCITPWDMDAALGQNYANTPGLSDELTKADNAIGDFTNIEVRLSAVFGKAYAEAKQQRYAQLRRTWFDEQQLAARFEAHYDSLSFSGASMRETTKWSMDSDLGGKALDFSDELAKIKDWIHQRLVYLDSKYGYSSTGITSVHHPTADDDAWYTLSGMRVPHPAKGVYIHKGRKVVVE